MSEPCRVQITEGLSLAVDHSSGDVEFLQELAVGKELVPVVVTLADGRVWRGKVQVGEMSQGISRESVELTLFAEVGQ